MTALDKLRDAMTTCLGGPPTAVVALRHKGAQADVPTAIDVLLREIAEEEPWVNLGTAGMSALPMQGPIERAELLLRVEGAHPRPVLEALARKLGDVAVAPFRAGFGLVEGMILDDVELPLYSGMRSLLVTAWSGEYDELPGMEPPVRLLELTPLFPREADIVRAVGAQEALRRFWDEGINPADPSREEARLEERAEEEDADAEEEGAVVADAAAPRSIDDVWREIDEWLAARAPRVSALLGAGAPAERLEQLEVTVGAALPAELRAFFSRHDGARSLGSYDLLPIEGVIGVWRDWNELLEDGGFGNGRKPKDRSGRLFQPVWWHRGWLPLAQDSGGNLLCVDLAPGPRGVRGQVLFWERETGPEASGLPSIGAWLATFLQGLQSGKYVVSEEGLLERRGGR